MKHFILVFFTLILVCNIKSQTIQIQGRLIDSLSQEPLPYSNIVIKNQMDSAITGALTNNAGEFKINLKTSGNFKLIASNLGYNEKIMSLIFEINKKYKIGNIALKQKSVQLNDAVIEVNKSYIEKKFDRKVININSNKTAAARTIFDLLRNLPGVIVDETGNIRYKGAEATIYVDDQPFDYVYPKIEMIPVNKVDKIELIDASMQTGGSGRGGIINIKFKIVHENGISGLASTNLNTIAFKDLDQSSNFVNLNYKKQKITFLNNCAFQNQIFDRNKETEKQFNAFQTPSIQNIDDKGRFNSNYYNDLVGLIYTASKDIRFFLGAGFFNYNYVYNFNENFLEKNNINNLPLSNYYNSGVTNFAQLGKGINFSYRQNLDTNDTYIRIFGSYKLDNRNNDQNEIYNYKILNSINIDSLYKLDDKTKNVIQKLLCTVLYNRTVSKDTRWNLSYSTSIAFKDNSATDHYISDKLYFPMSFANNSLTQQHDLSGRIGTTAKKWKIDGGLNFSDSYITGDYIRHNVNNTDTVLNIKKNYLKILPSATITYAITDTAEIKLTFSQTSRFPIFLNLSDFIDKKNPYFWSSGNSELKPSDFYSVYLAYSYNKEKWNASAESFLNYTNNDITNVSYPLSSLLALSKPDNIATKSSLGIDLSTWVQISNNFNFSLSSSLFYTNYNTMALKNIASNYNLATDNLIKTQFGYNIKYNMEFKFKKFFTMFYISYNSKELTFDGYNKPWINSSFNISRKFFDDKLNISTGINNIFDDLVEHGSYSTNFGVSTETHSHYSQYKRMYLISIQYTFRKGDRGTKDFKVN